MESDRWGVPLRMFGRVPEDFYSLIGCIVMVAALLEDRLHVLFVSLAVVPDQDLAGEPGTKLISECRKRRARFSAEQGRADEAMAFLTAAEAALNKRHEVVHSIWSFRGQSPVQGWRDLPSRKRRHTDHTVQWSSLEADELPDLLTDLVNLVERCVQVQSWVPSP